MKILHYSSVIIFLIFLSANIASAQEEVKYQFENNIFDSSTNSRTLSAVTGAVNLSYINDATKGNVASFSAGTNVLNVVDWVPVEGNDARTILLAVKTSTVTTPLCAWGSLAAGGKFFVQINNGILRLDVTQSDIRGETNIADGLWHHVAIVIPNKTDCTTGDIVFYVDGEIENTTVVNETMVVNTQSEYNFKLGSNHAAKQHYIGLMDDFVIAKSELTQAQVKAYAGVPTAVFNNSQSEIRISSVGNNIVAENLQDNDMVEVFSLTGQRVNKQVASTNRLTIPVTNSGVYIINVTNAGRIISNSKVVVNN